MSVDHIIIGKKVIAVEIRNIPQADLKFYVENPRLYAMTKSDVTPEQEAIEVHLAELEHVEQLKVSIECNGGVIEPLYVRDGDLVVLEGNSRLAAYRSLARENPENEKWREIRCCVLPEDIDEETVFTLLGQHHIIGRKDWEPYEQATYLYKRQQKTGKTVREMAEELGLSTKQANKYIKTIEFMIDHDDSNEKHFDCYENYLQNASIKKVRETELTLDDKVADAVKSEQIKSPREVVRQLRDTAKVAIEGDEEAQHVISEVARGNMEIRDAHTQIANSGKFENVVQKLRRFDNDICKTGFQSQLVTLTNTEELISRIDKIIERLQTFRASLEKGQS